MLTRRLLLWLALSAPCVGVEAQDGPPPLGPAEEQAPLLAPRGGSEFWIPAGSFFVPGLGQYIHGEPLAGLGYTATALAGYMIGAGAYDTPLYTRRAREQFEVEALHVAMTSNMLSAWDAFHRSIPRQRNVGRYSFLDDHDENVGDLLTAPFDVRFLGRWTTWVNLAFSGAVTAWVLENRNEGEAHPPLQGHDVAYAGALSLNAAVGEEALFRGWLLPMLTQKLGDRFWLANGVQAAIFGGLHGDQAGDYALAIAGIGLYNGWMTRRNDWSIREAIFQHFWYDASVVIAELLRDDFGTVTLMPITIRF